MTLNLALNESMQHTSLPVIFFACAKESPATVGRLNREEIETDMDTRSAVEMYFEGLESGDVSQIPLAENVRFVGPTLPKGVQGEVKVRALLADVAVGLKSLEAARIFVDGEHSCVPFVFVFHDDSAPPLAGVDCFRVVEGRIVEIQPFYDPRPLIDG